MKTKLGTENLLLAVPNPKRWNACFSQNQQYTKKLLSIFEAPTK